AVRRLSRTAASVAAGEVPGRLFAGGERRERAGDANQAEDAPDRGRRIDEHEAPVASGGPLPSAEKGVNGRGIEELHIVQIGDEVACPGIDALLDRPVELLDVREVELPVELDDLNSH